MITSILFLDNTLAGTYCPPKAGVKHLLFIYVCFVFSDLFEVVKEGRIFYNPKDFTRLNLVAAGTFSVDGRGRWLDNDGDVTRDL